jgi:hypothetical protein
MRRRHDGAIGRRTVLAGMVLGGLAAVEPGRAAFGASSGWRAPGLAAPAGLEALAAMAGGSLQGAPVMVFGPGWLATAQAVAGDAAALGLVLRAADDAAPWPGGAALEAASQVIAAPLALWSTVPLADRAAFAGLATGAAGVGGLGLAALGLRPVPLAAEDLAPALREGRIAAAAPPPGAACTALGLHRVAPYLFVAAGPPVGLRLCWLIAPGFAAALSPAARQALDAALRGGLLAALGGPAGATGLPGAAEAAARGVCRAALPPEAARAHAAALRALAAPAPGLV